MMERRVRNWSQQHIAVVSLEADRLISILRHWGICYLVGEEYPPSPADALRDQETSVNLIRSLARCELPRVRDATIALFIFHPELAPAVLEVLQSSEPQVREQVAVLTLATLYLQRLWSVRLTLALGHAPAFPEAPFAFLWEQHHLPPPACGDGEWGLVALQEVEQRRSGMPLTFRGDWQNQADHFLLQEEARRPGRPVAKIPTSTPATQQCQEEQHMPGTTVTKQQVEQFLQDLGRAFRGRGRMYLLGGAALVHAGVPCEPTQEIGLVVTRGDLYRAARKVAQAMNVAIEFTSLSLWIPLPSQWETMSRYVGRYGKIDVFYLDFYAVALSKMNRGNDRDIKDVKLLLQQELLSLAELDAAYEEVVESVGKGRYRRMDPQQFARRYQAIRAQL
jgi:hypothetical protein